MLVNLIIFKVLMAPQPPLILHCKEKQKLEYFSKLVFHCIHHRNMNEHASSLGFPCGLLSGREITAVGKTTGYKAAFLLKSLLN